MNQLAPVSGEPRQIVPNKEEIDDSYFGNHEYKKIWQERFGSIDEKIINSVCTNCHKPYAVTKTPRVTYVLRHNGQLVWWHANRETCKFQKDDRP